MTIVMRRATAALLTAHAIAHLAGFAWPWWVREPLPFPPDNAAWLGDTMMRSTSVIWMAVAMTFLVAAYAVVHSQHVWRWITGGAAIASLTLSAICWPGSLLGIPINLTILALLWWTRRPAWAA